jgi:hypothetical protein
MFEQLLSHCWVYFRVSAVGPPYHSYIFGQAEALVRMKVRSLVVIDLEVELADHPCHQKSVAESCCSST